MAHRATLETRALTALGPSLSFASAGNEKRKVKSEKSGIIEPTRRLISAAFCTLHFSFFIFHFRSSPIQDGNIWQTGVDRIAMPLARNFHGGLSMRVMKE
jgi:hypothetical protein